MVLYMIDLSLTVSTKACNRNTRYTNVHIILSSLQNTYSKIVLPVWGISPFLFLMAENNTAVKEYDFLDNITDSLSSCAEKNYIGIP